MVYHIQILTLSVIELHMENICLGIAIKRAEWHFAEDVIGQIIIAV